MVGAAGKHQQSKWQEGEYFHPGCPQHGSSNMSRLRWAVSRKKSMFSISAINAFDTMSQSNMRFHSAFNR
jgi:hypothetical protein